jgi:hypothetical protein
LLSASVPTLALHLCDSPRLRAVGFALHAVAVAAVLAIPAPLAVRMLLGATLLLVSSQAWRRRRPAVRRLELRGDGHCTIVDAQGTAIDGRLGAGSLAVPGLVVLQLEQRGRRRRGLWLSSDAFPDDGARRLRVRLSVAA